MAPNGNSIKNQDNYLPLPPQPFDISNWKPAAPKWEKDVSVERMLLKCEKFKTDTKQWGENGEDIFEQKFLAYNLKTFIYDSNAFEDAGENENETESLVNGVISNKYENTSGMAVSKLEVVNHMKALKKALELSPTELVSVEGIKCIHKVLMEGVLDSAGKLRTTPACSGIYHQYPDPSDVQELLEQVIYKYQCIERSDKYNIFTKAAWLKCQFVVVHPFEDGNGRLSRILVAALFMKSGLYILPSLSKNGHKRSTKHYINSLLKAAKGQSQGELAFFFLKCSCNIATELKQFILNSDCVV